ncbi:uncharacterized protein LOC107647391 [Arachis ipaensis]|nr:uncharacterized protein LOC107647391 [Arachis ipaensis]XP_025661931.1 uncharacterized protein LOC112757591 [Arachis hypogaea]
MAETMFNCKSCLNVSSTTPNSDLQTIEVGEETHSQPLEIAPIAVSLSSSLKEELLKDYYIYVLSDNDCPPEPKNQAGEGSFPRKTEPESPSNAATCPRQWEDDVPSFSFRISPPASQPTPPSQVTVTQPSRPFQPMVSKLEVLADVVIDAGVTAALKFVEATSAEPSFTAAEVYKTPEKEITEELKEKCYHLMTLVKETKDNTDEYDPLFILNHQANFEGLRHDFMSLMPRQHVESMVVNTHFMILNDIKCSRFEKDIYCVPMDIVMFMLGNHGGDYIDPKTKKAYRFDVDRYAHQRQFLNKRKLTSDPFLFVPICNGGHWWLWIVNV